MKTLFVIAGPNGAGKSTFGKELVISLNKDTFYFDGDKLTSKFKLKQPTILPGDLQEMLENHFFTKSIFAINNNLSFAYETNFSDTWLARDLAEMKRFKSKGYKTVLLFYDTIDIESSINRVKLRVISGGHNVSEDTINHNFKYSFNNFIKAYFQFDEAFIFDNKWSNNSFLPYCFFQFRNGIHCIDFEYIKKISEEKYQVLSKLLSY